jgi:hypothetical protein
MAVAPVADKPKTAWELENSSVGQLAKAFGVNSQFGVAKGMSKPTRPPWIGPERLRGR